jgi:hypothetical protein
VVDAVYSGGGLTPELSRAAARPQLNKQHTLKDCGREAVSA